MPPNAAVLRKHLDAAQSLDNTITANPAAGSPAVDRRPGPCSGGPGASPETTGGLKAR